VHADDGLKQQNDGGQESTHGGPQFTPRDIQLPRRTTRSLHGGDVPAQAEDHEADGKAD
jgi:hypothetical protein